MTTYNNEIEQFIYGMCYRPMWEAVYAFIAKYPHRLDLSYSRISYPDNAILEDMVLEFSKNIQIKEDLLIFDAVVSCTINLTEDNYRGFASCDLSQWLIVSCEANITDKLNSVAINSIKPYTTGSFTKSDRQKVSKNIVPLLYKKDLDDEATAFLSTYFPAALETPTPVPITEIAENMGLEVLQGHRLTDDFSIFGQIFFSEGEVNVYDLFKCNETKLNVHRGTILIDAYTFWERNLGCVNNTIAHEVYHWYKHRMYAAIKHILHGDNVIACRCPSNVVYPTDNNWSDEQRMEWQANNMAPRILMPIQTFQVKVHELYEKYNYSTSELKVVTITNIADELAKFYGVSRQSALIRMTETGFPEAAAALQHGSDNAYHAYLTREDAFYAYSNNTDFQKIVDSELFKYVEGYYVINDPQYIECDESGNRSLTAYAWLHLSECTLQFSSSTIKKQESHKHLPNVIMHRANTDQTVSSFDAKQNETVISEAIKRKREEFERQQKTHMLTFGEAKTCWQVMYEIIQSRGLSKPHFCLLTELGEEVYRKAEKNIATAPSLRTIVAFSRGLDLDLQTTEKLLQLAGHAFNDSLEHQALKFCITGFSGQSIAECNDFLKSYGYQPLGTQQRA